MECHFYSGSSPTSYNFRQSQEGQQCTPGDKPNDEGTFANFAMRITVPILTISRLFKGYARFGAYKGVITKLVITIHQKRATFISIPLLSVQVLKSTP